MKVTAFDLFRYRLPLTAPLVLKGVTLRHREGVLLRLRGADGAEGWGEAAPLPGFSRESMGKAKEQLKALRQRFLEGEEETDSWFDAGLAPSVRFALEEAELHLRAHVEGKTLPGVLGAPSERNTVAINGLLVGDEEAVLAEAWAMRMAGLRAAKLKVGRRPVGQDVALVRKLAGVLGEGVSLRLDANRAWSFQEAIAFAEEIAGCGVAYVEEPLTEAGRLPELAAATGLPVALDETLVGLPPEALPAHAYARAVVLKPTLLGGLHHALRLVHFAREAGMTAVVSSTFESGVGTCGLVALAAAIGDVPAGLDPYNRLADDLLHPRLDFHHGAIELSSAFDEGRRIKQEMLEVL